jgi:hypothetical protein
MSVYCLFFPNFFLEGYKYAMAGFSYTPTRRVWRYNRGNQKNKQQNVQKKRGKKGQSTICKTLHIGNALV